MTADLGKYEALLAEWRNKEAQAEALRQFRDSGGEHRLRISIDSDDKPVIASLMCSMMEGKGYHAILGSAVGRAEREAEAAKRAFLLGANPAEGSPL